MCISIKTPLYNKIENISNILKFENNFRYTQVFFNNSKYTQVFFNDFKYTQVFDNY